MATVVMCDVTNCDKKADFHLEEIPGVNGLGYILRRGGMDLCLEHLQGYRYTGGGTYNFMDKER